MNQQSFTIALADRTIQVNTLYKQTAIMCQNYRTTGTPDFSVSISQADIDLERKISIRDGDPEMYEGAYLETLAVYRKIATAMLDYDTFLMHGAAVAVGESAYLFTAKSGTGKTTHINLWLQRQPGAFVVNGDKPLIQLVPDGVYVCGTPWSGKEIMNTPTKVRLKAIVLMERAAENSIRPISRMEAFPFLLRQTYRPADAEQMKKTLALMEKLSGAVNLYRFQFNNFEGDAFRTAYDAITK